jgi:hypothetical protein
LAILNGIPCDIETERAVATGFAQTLKPAHPEETHPHASPLPSWEVVEKAHPQLLTGLAGLL